MRYLRLFYKIFLFCFFSFLIIIVGLYTFAYLSPAIDISNSGSYALYDDTDTLVYQGTNANKWVTINEISPNLINAVISIEDKNFYNHNGFDYIRIVKALFNNMKNHKIVEGASTISQQYIKNAFLDFDQKWSRKIKEAMMTLNLEVHYTKDEILEAYLNTINYGQGNYGINSASLYYFNKKPSDLTLEEALILAGIPKSPNNYNPVISYENAIKRAQAVALSMRNNKYIDEETYQNLFKNEIKIEAKNSDKELQTLMYYRDAVYKELLSLNKIDPELIKGGKLKVYTSLNLKAQSVMEEKMLKYIPNDRLQTSGVIINPANGEIMALTGGIDYKQSQYNRALLSKRQVGSTMKPFLYYSALEHGMTSSSTFLSQYTTFNLGNGKTYSPRNYANLYGNKDITMAAAIAYSDNIYAVKTNLFLGVEELIKTAHKCGITANLQEVASLPLGTSEINILDFAQGYTTLASGGYKRNIHFIRKITDENDNILYEYERENNLVLNPNYVYILNEIMTSTTNPAFKDYNNPTALGIASKLSQKYALKTGTTNTDYWVVGYNKDILMVTWTGYDDSSDIETNLGVSAKKVWAETIESVVPNHNGWYQMPKNIVGVPLNAVDGTPTKEVSKTTMFYYVKGSEPSYSLSDYN